jgi:hypothetical protein
MNELTSGPIAKLLSELEAEFTSESDPAIPDVGMLSNKPEMPPIELPTDP